MHLKPATKSARSHIHTGASKERKKTNNWAPSTTVTPTSQLLCRGSPSLQCERSSRELYTKASSHSLSNVINSGKYARDLSAKFSELLLAKSLLLRRVNTA